MKTFSYTLWRVRIPNIKQISSSSIFMKAPIYTFVVSAFIEVQSLFFFRKWLNKFNFHSPQSSFDLWLKIIILKCLVHLLESKLYLWKFVFLHSSGEFEFTFSSPQKSTDDSFKMA